jgi:AraC-like DNA-binding protein
MATVMNQQAASRLERSCGPAGADWMRIAPSSPGLERFEAAFSGHAFDPHRHDTYAIGYTIEGVQSFRYRGTPQNSVAGQVFVVHPDEIHDGHAGTPAGFRYRIMYVEPKAVQEALGEGPLPFVRETVSRNRALANAIVPALEDLDRPLEELQHDQILLNIAEALAAADSSVARRSLSARHIRAVTAARELLDAHVETGVASATLEAATGLTRFAVARHFRACLGTSPYRYLVMRRLDRARALIRRGAPLAEAAIAAGFADQSHMTRQFKRAYGMSPGRWAALCGTA